MQPGYPVAALLAFYLIHDRIFMPQKRLAQPREQRIQRIDLGGKAAERIFFHLDTHKSYPGIRRGSKYFIVSAMVLIVAAFAVGKKIEDREGKKI